VRGWSTNGQLGGSSSHPKPQLEWNWKRQAARGRTQQKPTTSPLLVLGAPLVIIHRRPGI